MLALALFFSACMTTQTQVLFCYYKRENNKVIGGVLGAGIALVIATNTTQAAGVRSAGAH
ncbi:MAG: hypothetical protein MR927_04445 [Campylobacter sp.]|nr:hypothetical protein [Campylobacter sp.]